MLEREGGAVARLDREVGEGHSKWQGVEWREPATQRSGERHSRSGAQQEPAVGQDQARPGRCLGSWNRTKHIQEAKPRPRPGADENVKQEMFTGTSSFFSYLVLRYWWFPGLISSSGSFSFRLPLRKRCDRGFLGGSVVKNPLSSAGDVGSISGRGTKLPQAMGQLSPYAATAEPACHS